MLGSEATPKPQARLPQKSAKEPAAANKADSTTWHLGPVTPIQKELYVKNS